MSNSGSTACHGTQQPHLESTAVPESIGSHGAGSSCSSRRCTLALTRRGRTPASANSLRLSGFSPKTSIQRANSSAFVRWSNSCLSFKQSSVSGATARKRISISPGRVLVFVIGLVHLFVHRNEPPNRNTTQTSIRKRSGRFASLLSPPPFPGLATLARGHRLRAPVFASYDFASADCHSGSGSVSAPSCGERPGR
jgi:hypothetical protein